MNLNSSLRASRRVHLVVCLSVCAFAPAALAADAMPYFQGGVSHDVSADRETILITTDGTVPFTTVAVDLAAQKLGSTFKQVGSTGHLYEVSVDKVTPQLLAQLEAQDGVLSAYKIIRFRDGGHPVGVTGQVYVKFETARHEIELGAFAEEYNLSYVPDLTERLGLPTVYVFDTLSDDPYDALLRADAIHAHPGLSDWKATAGTIVPLELRQAVSDPLFDIQWHLKNTGQSGGRTGADIKAIEAWDVDGVNFGEGVILGMLDSGCDVGHPDLEPNFSGASFNLVSGDSIAVDTVEPHGTAVMGLMVAAANSIGVRGVAPAATFSPSGTGPTPINDVSDAQLASAYSFAIEQEVQVHNNSWGNSFPGFLADVIVEGITEAANYDEEGMVILFAAGNSGQELDPGDDYGTLAEVIQVGATGQNDTIAFYSDYGATQDVMGPTRGDDGVGLVTTDVRGPEGINDGDTFFDLVGQPDYTKTMSGTSGATPVVSGVAALVLAVNPSLNRIQVREVLTHTAEQVTPRDAEYNPATNFSLEYGYGRVDAWRAAEAAERSLVESDLTWPSIPSDLRARLNTNPGYEDAEIAITFSWVPAGMPPKTEGGPVTDTEEEEILIAYKPGGEDEAITWHPVDGETYGGGGIEDPDDGDRPDSDDADLVILYSGPPTDSEESEGGNRRSVVNLGIDGTPTGNEPQLFAVFTINDETRYSHGIVIDEEGQPAAGAPDEGSTGDNPDNRPPIDPEQIVINPGLLDPPSVTATADLTVGTAPLTVLFHGSAVTPNELLDRGWSFGDGSSSSANSVEHTYEFPETYSAVYFAQDDTGDIATKLLQIRVLDPSGDTDDDGPLSASASIEVVTLGKLEAPNALVRFTVDTTGIGDLGTDSLVTYEWDFGDGNAGIGQTTENIFADPGFYAIVVQVTEKSSDGRVLAITASSIVEIEGTPSFDPGSSSDTIELDGIGGDGNDGGTSGGGTCGMLGLGLMACMTLGLVGLRRRRG